MLMLENKELLTDECISCRIGGGHSHIGSRGSVGIGTSTQIGHG